MRSLRLDPELDQQVQQAAAVRGESVSEFIRIAAKLRADKTLLRRQSERFADVAGVVRGGGGQARRSGEAFTEAIGERRGKQ